MGTRNIVKRMFGWSPTTQPQESGSDRSGLSPPNTDGLEQDAAEVEAEDNHQPHVVSPRQRCWNIDQCRDDSE